MSLPDALPYRVSHIPVGNANRPRIPMVPRWLTFHETGNPNIGANAEMHRRFTHNGGGTGGVSFHVTVDDTEAIELLPFNENGWHAGDGYNGTGNRSSIGVEICVNADGDWQATLRKAARLGVKILAENPTIEGVSYVVQHNRWSGKNCPARLRQAGWENFVANITGMVAPPATDIRTFDRVGFYLQLGFKAEWERLESYGHDDNWRHYGYPMSNETPDFDLGGGHRVTVQLFERGAMIYDPNVANERWRITRANNEQYIRIAQHFDILPSELALAA